MSWNAGHLLKSGQYEVIQLIGSGGFGMTYLAKDLNLARQVVIKRPNLSFEADRDYDKFLRRFKREGQVLAQLKIPNIVRVIEFTEVEGMPCLVMDFVAGETLNECIRRRKFIPEDEAWPMFEKLASAVEALHQRGIIHCDIHPGNIIVQPNGEPVLIDFGSTKLLHPTTWTVTTTVNKDFGPYEQMAGSEENTRGSQPAWDIYSLAANMFFAVTGQKPTSAISRKLYDDGIKSPKELKPGLSNRLNRMIIKGMALEAKDRPISVAVWISLRDFSPQPFTKSALLKTKKRTSSSSYLFFKKKTNASFPWQSMSILILGYFPHGIILGNCSWDVAWAWVLAWAGTLVLDLGESLALVFNWLLVLALILVFAGTGVWAWACIGSSIGAWAGVLFGGWFIDNSLFEDQDNALLRIFILCGALLGGVFSGYLADTGVVWGWGICCGFLTLASFTAIILGCTISEDRLKKKYNSVQVFLIYGVFSSIGLISGGTLGSWLKVAGIIKLP